MIENIIAVIKNWKAEVNKVIKLDQCYLFGSTIYREGITFQPEISDLDIIVVIPNEYETALKRKNWLRELKKHKTLLEKEMVSLMGKKYADKEIISLVPITEQELKHDIHKGGARNFFRTNEFLNIDDSKLIDGKELVSYIDLSNELATQVFEAVQKKRNMYLKNSSVKDDELLTVKVSTSDILPKELAREAAKVNAIISPISHKGDQFNLAFGTDFLRTYLFQNRSISNDLEQLYFWMDARSGGRTNVNDKTTLSQEDHLLFYEILFDNTLHQINKLIKEKEEIEKNDKRILEKVLPKVDFMEFLNSSDLLAKAHSKKETILLSDIYIHPDLSTYNSERAYAIMENSEQVIDEFLMHPRIVIAGENQSGKTALCKIIYKSLIEKGLVPIYLCDKTNNYLGNTITKIETAFKEQYTSDVGFDSIRKELIVPIIDDFHFAKRKEKIALELSIFQKQVLIVDDIFGLNFKDETIIQSYVHYKILELKPSFRNKLIKKWLSISFAKTGTQPDENEVYTQIDKSTELVNTALGKIIGSGIMPAYPFFILSVISTFETFDKPLEQEITSQGYCYQALLYMYLRKQNVKNDDIDTYINFLTELSFYFYSNGNEEIDQVKFDSFINDIYFPNYNLHIPIETLLSNLSKTNIFIKNSLGNYDFSYRYLYYFFVGKYFADHIEEEKTEIIRIINNLHTDDNAYIAVFISHHTKNSFVLDEIVKTAGELFPKFKPATLSVDELDFFDSKAELIIEAILPKSSTTPEKAREELLKQQDQFEPSKNDNEKDEDIEDEFAREMRRSIKTVEVMGSIIKNRSGSLLKPKLESIFSEGMKVHLKIISSFIELIKDESNQNEIEELLTGMLNKTIKEKGINPSPEKLKTLSKSLFWNVNFAIVYSLINKIIHSLGSDKLNQIIESVCNQENTPASFIVKQGIYMWYNKNLQLESIANTIDNDGFSKTAKQIMNYMVVKHCRLHTIGYKDLQKIENRLGIPSRIILSKNKKNE